MATYAIGDIQGCAGALRDLIALLPWDPQRDRLWFVGDLVNRGPESAEVLRLIKNLGDRAQTVLGNHDLYVLAAGEGVLTPRAKDTFTDVLEAPDRLDLLQWLRHQPLLYEEPPYVMVHAGLLPQWSLQEARVLAQEVAEALQGPDFRKLMEHLFALERQNWGETLRGMPRLKTIIDVMTRLRACTANGEINYHFKGELKDLPIGWFPWFQAPNRRHAEATVVFGHWSALGLYVGNGVIGLDSGCVWGRTLTAVRLEDRAIFQVPCEQCRAPKRS